MRPKSWRPLYAMAAIVLSAGFLLGCFALMPALARGGEIKIGPYVIIRCSSASPCEQYVNTGAGPGLEGKSTSDTGGYGLEGIATGGGIGVFASGAGRAEYATSQGDDAIDAITMGPFSFAITGTGNSAHANGIEGVSRGDGAGVMASSVSGFGMQTSSGSGAGLFAAGSPAIQARGFGDGVDATGNGSGFYAVDADNDASGGAGSENIGSYVGIVGRAPTGTSQFPLVLTDMSDTNVFYVDGNGDVYYHGTLNTFTPMIDGKIANAYGAKSTSPTIEDDGTGYLVNGVAMVGLHPTFAQTIDPRATYHVMLTPDGDTRGLFVASKSPTSFVVREVQGGHSTLTFDYHIYAPALGLSAAHMAVLGGSVAGPRLPIRLRHIPSLVRRQ